MSLFRDCVALGSAHSDELAQHFANLYMFHCHLVGRGLGGAAPERGSQGKAREDEVAELLCLLRISIACDCIYAGLPCPLRSSPILLEHIPDIARSRQLLLRIKDRQTHGMSQKACTNQKIDATAT